MSEHESVEWTVRVDEERHGSWWLSVHQCPTCFALVVEDFLPDHQRWHGDHARAHSAPESTGEAS